MTALWLLAGALLVVAGVQVVIAWVFATSFRREALRVQGPRREYGVWVRDLDDEIVTLESAEPRQEMGHPGVLGVWWEHGYGQALDIVDVEGFRVRRPFRLLEGEPPHVCLGPLEDCVPVSLEGYAFPRGPEDVGLEFEEVTYRSPLGSMPAWKVGDTTSRWAIHVHGWTAERREAVRLLTTHHRAGHTSLVIDYRNDPGSPEDPSGHYRFGVTEWEDVEGAVELAMDSGATDVVLVGYSTGGAHVLSFLERSRLASSVCGLVLDSPNIALAETVRHGSADMSIPGLGVRGGRLAVELGMLIADLRWKVDWEATNYVERADRIVSVPTLVFHGTADRRVPIAVSRRLAAKAPQLVELVETQAAGHVMSWNADPRRYETLLGDFLVALPAQN